MDRSDMMNVIVDDFSRQLFGMTIQEAIDKNLLHNQLNESL